jgi:CBS domain containing-hemolysin-like protein
LETEPPPFLQLFEVLQSLATADIILVVVLVLLLFLSALISGSEVAYFSITPADRELMDDSNPRE